MSAGRASFSVREVGLINGVGEALAEYDSELIGRLLASLGAFFQSVSMLRKARNSSFVTGRVAGEAAPVLVRDETGTNSLHFC